MLVRTLLGWGEFTVTRQFQSRDWVDVGSDITPWLMISAIISFQSRDWVDVGSDRFDSKAEMRRYGGFNPATGLMLVRTSNSV